MASSAEEEIWLFSRYPSVTAWPLSATSNPYWPLPLMKLLSNRLLTLVFLMLAPFWAAAESTIPDPPQSVTSTFSTSACQFMVMMPSVRPLPLQATVRLRMLSGPPVVVELLT